MNPRVLYDEIRRIMESKESNIVLAADLDKIREVISIAKDVGDEIVILKTHVDIYEDFTHESLNELKDISQEMDFLIMEDRKFCDIGKTVERQYSKGTFRIVDWAHLVTVSLLPGPGILDGISRVIKNRKLTGRRGVVLLARMSSNGNLARGEYTEKCIDTSIQRKDLVTGLIVTGEEILKAREKTGREILLFTPGVRITRGTGELGQRYLSVEEVINLGTDLIIVGSGITSSSDPMSKVSEYRKLAWKYYSSSSL